MSFNSGSSIDHLRHIATHGSRRYDDAGPSNPSAPYQAGAPRTQSVFRAFYDLFATLKEDAATNKLRESMSSDNLAVGQHESSVRSQQARHAIDVDRVVMDDAEQRRAQDMLRTAEAWTAIRAVEALRATAIKFDRLIQRSEQEISDPDLRKAHATRLRSHYDLVAERLHATTYGLDYDPENILGRS